MSKQGSCESCEAAFELEFVGSFFNVEVTTDRVDSLLPALSAGDRWGLLSLALKDELVSDKRIQVRTLCRSQAGDLNR